MPDLERKMTGTPRLFEGEARARSVSPLLELGAYETLWLEAKASFKRIADLFRAEPGALPSDLVTSKAAAKQAAEAVQERLSAHGIRRFGVRVHRAGEYPDGLRDAENPVELLYYQGWWNLVETRCIAVVGTRNPSPEGVRRTRKLVQRLVKDDWTIVSGLATGIDTVAHETALAAGGRTIAVLGTPIGDVYPPANAGLQKRLASEFLVISQVPVLKYARQTPRGNRLFFPERNITMSALTAGTIIVEAGQTSGTLIQARAALRQRRKLFILDSCFQRPELTWPPEFERQGAIRTREYAQIQDALSDADSN